ncbi:MAG: bifunctional glycosyltransferase family 2 protein/CDP-glycerol:glycerophosphate glycerophosphotransferase [Actinoplanes sp.]
MANFITVVVPAWGVQGYLGECLDSILRDETAELQVIGVDDASPEHSGVVLDERAATDPRLSVIHLDVNVGPGPARNAGLDAATGEYVWFVDGDDRLVPGALAAVEAELRATDADVLVVGMARERWNRKVSVWKPAVTPIAGLVVRREFLVGSGIRFEPGWYEDLDFTHRVRAAARTTATLDAACVIHRLDRLHSIRGTRSPRHTEAIEQWDKVLSRGDGQIGVAVTDLLGILNDGKRVPKGDRRAFYDRIRDLSSRYRGATLRPYPWFEIARRAPRPSVGKLKGRLRKRALRGYYRWQLSRPMDDKLAVYAAYWYRGYACNPAAIYEKARELAPDVRGVWVVKPGNAKAMPKGVDYVVSGSRAYYRAIARARYLVNNATFPPDVVKRPGAVHVQTHHGTPLKTMGLDQPKYPASTVGYDAERLRRNIAKWDFSVTANRHTTLFWDRQFPIDGETLETGYPRNDRLARATAEDTAAARAELGIKAGERVVVYAPTHREWHAEFTPVLDVDALAEALGPDTRILLRGHYFYGSIGFPPRHPRVLDVSAHPSVETLYLAADVLITDYSSVMFDYAVLDKPLVIFAPDWEIYRAVRGVTFDLSAEPPGVFATTFDELVAAFRTGAVGDELAAKARGRFRELFCSLEDGGGAERVVRRVFLGEKVPVLADRKVHVHA